MLRFRRSTLAMILCLGVLFPTFLLVFGFLFVTTSNETIIDSEIPGTSERFSFTENSPPSYTKPSSLTTQTTHHYQGSQKSDDKVTVVLVLCGERDDLVHQTVTGLKSMALLTRSTLHAIVIVDSWTSEDLIRTQVRKWPKPVQSKFKLSFRSVWYPKGYEWMKNYRTLCTTERLYLPSILLDEDAVLYLDTDIIFLDDVENLWRYFRQMNSSQIAAMAPEHEVPENAFYNSPYNKIPHYGSLGLNAGVLLMNLTRIRSFPGGWTNTIHKIYEKYKYSPLHFADQDILNIIFHMYPEKLFELPCKWNFRSDHCSWKGNTCPSAEKDGVSLLHGNRNVFHNMRDLSFRTVYKAFLNYSWTPPEVDHFVDSLTSKLKKEYNTLCGSDFSIFTSRICQIINKK